MSNIYLQRALQSLSSAGAQGLPTPSQVEAAADGTKWNGKKANGDPWELIKNGPESFNTTC